MRFPATLGLPLIVLVVMVAELFLPVGALEYRYEG